MFNDEEMEPAGESEISMLEAALDEEMQPAEEDAVTKIQNDLLHNRAKQGEKLSELHALGFNPRAALKLAKQKVDGVHKMDDSKCIALSDNRRSVPAFIDLNKIKAEQLFSDLCILYSARTLLQNSLDIITNVDILPTRLAGAMVLRQEAEELLAPYPLEDRLSETRLSESGKQLYFRATWLNGFRPLVPNREEQETLAVTGTLRDASHIVCRLNF